MPFFYQVYGLILQANFPIVGLVERAETNCLDISVQLAADLASNEIPVPTSAWQLLKCQYSLWEAALPDGSYLRFRYAHHQDYVDYIIAPQGRQIWISCSEGVAFQDIVAFLVGPVLGCVLRLRGVTCLHSNVIVAEAHAIAIAGHKGAGKSTTAAAFIQRGQQLLADDIAVLTEQQDAFWVQPGYPRLRLLPETADSLYGSAQTLPTVFSQPDRWLLPKCYLSVEKEESAFPEKPLPLAAIYILEQRDSSTQTVSLESLSPTNALLSLLPHTYTNWILDQTERKREFETLSQLVQKIPVKRVHRPDDLAKLPELCEVILEDVKTLMKDKTSTFIEPMISAI